jgi:hypothetical protein
MAGQFQRVRPERHRAAPRWIRLPVLIVSMLGLACPMDDKQRRPAEAEQEPSAADPSALRGDSALAAVLEEAGVTAEQVNCNERVLWIDDLDRQLRDLAGALKKLWDADPAASQGDGAEELIKTRFLRLLLEHARPQNFGAMRLAGQTYVDARGQQRPLLIYRSALTTNADEARSCVRTLLGPGQVAHIINLYDGEVPLRSHIEMEAAVAKSLGATHHDAGKTTSKDGGWRTAFESEKDYQAERDRAMHAVARLIRQAVLRPGGKPPRGNIYLHCAGGMHRSGIVFGILRRCLNRDPLELIETEYKRHTAYRSANQPGGFEPLNLRFIREFDCSLLGAASMPGR